MSKGLSFAQVKMYCTMVEEKFEPVLIALRKKQNEKQEQEIIDVQKDLGIYEMMCSMKKLRESADQLEKEVAAMIQSKGLDCTYHYHLIDSIERAIDQEANRRLQFGDPNPEDEIQKTIKNTQDKVKLAMVGFEIVDIFNGLDKIIADKLAALK